MRPTGLKAREFMKENRPGANRAAQQGAGDSVDRNSIGTDWTAAWETEDNYWNENFSSRPYTVGSDYYERFRPAYRYGFESAHRGNPRSWDEAEPELSEGWDGYKHRGEDRSTWEEIKHAVRDAWERVTGEHHAGASRQ